MRILIPLNAENWAKALIKISNLNPRLKSRGINSYATSVTLTDKKSLRVRSGATPREVIISGYPKIQTSEVLSKGLPTGKYLGGF